MEKVRSALRRLDLSDPEQTVYLTLITGGKSTARMLSAKTGITRPSVYDQLKTLSAIGLVVELDIDGKSYFAASEIKHLDYLLEDRIDRLEQSRVFLSEAIPTLQDSIETVQPRVRFFEGADGVKQLVKDILWHDNITIYMLWPHKRMTEVLDEKFLGWFSDRLKVRRISTHVLFTSTAPHMPLKHNPGDKHRVLTKGTDTDMAYIIYKNKTALISSSSEAFGFIVDSSEYARLMQMQFDVLWKDSKLGKKR